MKVSLLISVYKNVKDLSVVLQGLKFQSYGDFEIVIAEDGQDPHMRAFVESQSFVRALTHVSQPDVGWRKNEALNRAIKAANGDYLIFIDGDCVLHHKFIENHVRYAQQGRILGGKRIKLGQRYSDLFRAGIDRLPELERKVMLESLKVKSDGARFYEECFYINPDGILGFIPRLRKMNQLKGCNMSFYKQDIELINGFDEDYHLPAIGEL